MWISVYFTEFIVFSFIGWIWETIYCTIMNGKWENRGFLFGPVCPIYGVGAIGGFALLDVRAMLGMPTLLWWEVALIAFFGSAVLEYGTSVALEKLFHASWWDYSEMPLNFQGRICLPASLGFTAAGFLIVYVVYPLCGSLVALVPPILFEAAAMVLLVLFSIDMTLTISALTDIQAKISAVDDNINVQMTEFVDNLYKNTGDLAKNTVARIRTAKFPKPTQTKVFTGLMERIKRK